MEGKGEGDSTTSSPSSKKRKLTASGMTLRTYFAPLALGSSALPSAVPRQPSLIPSPPRPWVYLPRVFTPEDSQTIMGDLQARLSTTPKLIKLYGKEYPERRLCEFFSKVRVHVLLGSALRGSYQLSSGLVALLPPVGGMKTTFCLPSFQDGHGLMYSGSSRASLGWPAVMERLADKAAELVKQQAPDGKSEPFTAALVNLYRNGEDSMVGHGSLMVGVDGYAGMMRRVCVVVVVWEGGAQR
jgi:hypothetical protein